MNRENDRKIVIFCPLTRGKKRILPFFRNLFRRFTHRFGFIFSLLSPGTKWEKNNIFFILIIDPWS